MNKQKFKKTYSWSWFGFFGWILIYFIAGYGIFSTVISIEESIIANSTECVIPKTDYTDSIVFFFIVMVVNAIVLGGLQVNFQLIEEESESKQKIS